MPRAAPGEVARGAVRRKLPEYQGTLARQPGRSPVNGPHRSRMEMLLHRIERGNTHVGFTRLLSGIGVERGRLGEVVSLVGDCRPPPPGNPLRPPGTQPFFPAGRASTTLRGKSTPRIEENLPRHGDITVLISLPTSFNNYQNSGNLKDLKSSEYFKKNRSYFTCICKLPVLKFGSFHSHMCGLKGAEPPSIAMTNVLELQE